MLNLLRFKLCSAQKDCRKHGTAFDKLIRQYGGNFIYNGRVAQRFVGDDDWHAVALLRYPSRKVFFDLTTSEEYVNIHGHRENCLE